MQYVRSISGSVSKTWNSINPATLSGAIDVIVVEQEDGSLACSPFHVRFGKFSLLRPSQKKVEFMVNGVKQNYSMKLGEEGEAFFVFETSEDIPEDLQTSPLVSPENSPSNLPAEQLTPASLAEPTFLDLTDEQKGQPTPTRFPGKSILRETDAIVGSPGSYTSYPGVSKSDLNVGSWTSPVFGRPTSLERSSSEEHLSISVQEQRVVLRRTSSGSVPREEKPTDGAPSGSPRVLKPKEALNRALTLSKKLSTSNIRSKIT